MNEFTPPDFNKWAECLPGIIDEIPIANALQQAYLQGYTKGSLDKESEFQAKAFIQD